MVIINRCRVAKYVLPPRPVSRCQVSRWLFCQIVRWIINVILGIYLPFDKDASWKYTFVASSTNEKSRVPFSFFFFNRYTSDHTARSRSSLAAIPILISWQFVCVCPYVRVCTYIYTLIIPREMHSRNISIILHLLYILFSRYS